jgi:protein-S-isoprenylcysteine O-methyltransferase Ste14
VGAVVAIAGGVVAVRSALLLRGRGRPRRGPQPALVIAGPYRRLRNPIAAGLLATLAGVALAVASPALGALTVAAAVAAHAWIVLVEVPRLATRFGPAYDAYRRHVRRWWPRPIPPDDAEPADGPARR